MKIADMFDNRNYKPWSNLAHSSFPRSIFVSEPLVHWFALTKSSLAYGAGSRREIRPSYGTWDQPGQRLHQGLKVTWKRPVRIETIFEFTTQEGTLNSIVFCHWSPIGSLKFPHRQAQPHQWLRWSKRDFRSRVEKGTSLIRWPGSYWRWNKGLEISYASKPAATLGFNTRQHLAITSYCPYKNVVALPHTLLTSTQECRLWTMIIWVRKGMTVLVPRQTVSSFLQPWQVHLPPQVSRPLEKAMKKYLMLIRNPH